MEKTLLFEKKFTFERDEFWVLPSFSNWYVQNTWTISELQHLKCELNATKSLLNDKNIKSWRKHTSYTNPAGLVLDLLRKKIKPELVTQAWCKFYEILETYPLFSGKSILRTFHLCEAPGAFITALNHYLCSRFSDQISWHWMANTLNPYYEETSCRSVIVDDRLLLPTLEKWHFGIDNTGDILNPGFLDSLSKIEGKWDLVSADGSIDCQDCPEEQEAAVMHLHLAEVVTAICLLNPSGSLVIKMFTFFECTSVCLLYLLNTLFEKVHIFKPATSKPGNSEVYVICLNYFGVSDKFLDNAKRKVFCASTKKALFCFQDIPGSFVRQLLMCCQLFKDFQEDTIRKNLTLFQCMSPAERSRLDAERQTCAVEFLERFKIRSVERDKRLVREWRWGQSLNWAIQDNKGIAGSLNDRRTEQNKSWEEQLQSLECAVREFSHQMYRSADLCFGTQSISMTLEKEIANAKGWIVRGRPICSVKSSKFCPILLITWWNKLFAKMTEREVPQWPTEACQYLNSIHFGGSVLFLSPSCNREVLRHVKISGIPFCASEILCCYPSSQMILAETSQKKCFLDGCLHALRFARPGQSLVLRVTTMLTRFTVGILYLLASCFCSIRVIPSSLENSMAYWWLECFCTANHIESVKSYLEFIRDELDLDSNNSTVLQVLPMQTLCKEPFYSFIYETNADLMITAILDTIQKERQLFNQS